MRVDTPASNVGTHGAGHAAAPCRRRRDWLLCCVVATQLAACQAPPASPAIATATATAAEQRAEEFGRLGFKRADDGWVFSFPGKLLFDVASDALDADSQETADRIGKGLQQLGIEALRVEGHTDSVGSVAYNQTLSLRRAEAVARALAMTGLPATGMQVRGLGKDNPVADNSTPEGRLQNRRVAVIVPAL